MTTTDLTPATVPTMYFIGVTTGGSAVHRVFRAWKPLLNLGDVELVGIDIAVDAPVDEYRRVVEFLRSDPLSSGALVTTHKLAVYEACADMFAVVNDDARRLHEVSALVARDGSVEGHALDTITSKLSLHAIAPDLHGCDVLIMGAGGAALALCDYFAHRSGRRAPERVVVTDIVPERVQAIDDNRRDGSPTIDWDIRVIAPDEPHDDVVNRLRPGALIVNATGLGKDRPGSPTTDDVVFPQRSAVWEFNYRGQLDFLRQAERQAEHQELTVEDGWRYFIHGWTRAIDVVFDIGIPTSGPGFDAYYDASLAVR